MAKNMIRWINLCQLVCLEVPLPPYIKEPRGEEAPARRRWRRRSPTPTGSRTPPPNPIPTRIPKGERGRGVAGHLS